METGRDGRHGAGHGLRPAQESKGEMILADTSVWVDPFRRRDAALHRQLQGNNISIHPFIVAELALGNLPDRKKTIAYLDLLPMVKVAQTSEVRRMIEARLLFHRGIGFVDVHLQSPCLYPHYAA